MDKVRKLLSSPSTRRKNAAAAAATAAAAGPSQASSSLGKKGMSSVSGGYFGVALEELARREKRDVPYLVTKVCDYIYTSGLDQEGIFRVSGSARVVELMRGEFDRFGDADLAASDDIMAVAGLLKLFLRELPDGIISQTMTPKFVALQEEFSGKKEQCLDELKELLQQLPRVNYNTLKYIMRFLVMVTKEEEQNKMSPVALGIVFGPSIFSSTGSSDNRCSSGTQGLREQGTTNHIAVKFIVHYDLFFLNKNETSPYSAGFVPDLKRGKVPPPRPPPPRIDDSPPIPSPRKQRSRLEDVASMDLMGSLSGGGRGGPVRELDIVDGEDLHLRKPTPSHSLCPLSDQEEFIDTPRANSPIRLDSARSESGALDSIIGLEPASTEVVERVIASAVTEHLFGDPTNSMSSDEGKNDSFQAYTDGPVPAPRKKHRKRPQEVGSDSCSESSNTEERMGLEESSMLPVRQRVKAFEVDEETADLRGKINPNKESRKNKPSSKAFQLFEDEGILIKPNPQSASISSPCHLQDTASHNKHLISNGYDKSHQTQPKPRTPKRECRAAVMDQDHSMLDSDDSGFGTIQRVHTPLTNFKRAPGPKNRRNPTRSKMSPPASNQHHQDHILPDVFLDTRQHSKELMIQDVNHNESKHSISFLELHHNGSTEERSPDRSPSASRKPYIPPLDFSTLHEHGDGSEPIPAQQGMSVCLHQATSYGEDGDCAMLSPRTAKMKQKKRESANTDVPPSPPTEQTLFLSGKQEDDQNQQIKHLTKKIQSCKRKIKMFEEDFELEHGYRPSQTDKAAQPEIKKYIQELARARKELRKLKEANENQKLGYSSGGSLGTPISEPASSPDIEQSVLPLDTLNQLLERLRQKRHQDSRPEDLTLMTREEVQCEKIDIQKSLLQFEGQHGRPSTKAEKELMRPLYDRYRNIKRLLAKPLSPREKLTELESVPEDSPVDFTSSANTYPQRDKGGVHGDVEDNFLVTRDLRLLQTTSANTPQKPHEAVCRELHFNHDTPSIDQENMDLTPEHSPSRSLHELSRAQLLEEQHSARQDKKRLRKSLREFEEDFLCQTGRKVQKEDRAPMEAEYLEYKQVKAKLKLLDALLSKHQTRDIP